MANSGLICDLIVFVKLSYAQTWNIKWYIFLNDYSS